MIKERQVAGIAVDTLSLDNGPSKEFKTHKMWLPSGRWGLENVANLGEVPAERCDPRRRRPQGEGRDRRPDAGARAGVAARTRVG